MYIMKPKRILFFILIVSIHLNVFSQRCGTMEKMNRYLSNNIEIKKTRDSIEKSINSSNEINQKLSINIPVVFHVVYNEAEENISDLQIMSQLNVLNQDFNRTNPDAFSVPSDFDSIVSSMQINFCLARRTPSGEPTTGIIRTSTNNNGFNLFDTTIHYTNMGGSDAWNTDKYLNIWVAKINGGTLGWAQFPIGGSQYTDGVVIDYQHFGTMGTAIYPYNLGRTTTHELGHYFNLYHLWGDNYCGDDLVNDTPIQEESNFGCKTHPHISCNNNGDMFMNFMDYSNDNCMNSFTIGQRNRVWSSIYNYRLSLISSDGSDEVKRGKSDASIKISHPNGFVEGCNNPIYPKVIIKNISNVTLNTALIKYKINSSNTNYQLWSGSLDFNETDTVYLSGIPIEGTSHIIEVELLHPNNNNDIDTSNNKDLEIFQTINGTNININLITDNYANENSWIFLDNNNNIIDSQDTLEDNYHYVYKYCLTPGCYKFIMFDSQGDGICCNYGNGNATINKEHNNYQIGELSHFSYADTISFCFSALSDMENITITNKIYPNPSSGKILINSSIFTPDLPIIAKIYDIY